MRKIFLLMMTVVTALFLGGCGNDDAERYGSIFGVITDKESGEPMRASGVELFKNNLLITRAVTGNEGQFEFQQLEASDDYFLSVVISGFRSVTFPIQVRAGRISRADIQLEQATSTSPDYIVLQSDGIMVQRNDITSGASWSVAYNLCQTSRVGGRTGWRLPTRGELTTLYNQRDEIGGFVTASGTVYWGAQDTNDRSWVVNFGWHMYAAGTVWSIFTVGQSFRARCVRTLP